MGYREEPPTSTAAGRLLDVPQLCDYLGLTERQVRHLVETGQIPVTRLDRRLRFDVVAIDRWIKKSTAGAA